MKRLLLVICLVWDRDLCHAAKRALASAAVSQPPDANLAVYNSDDPL